VSHTTGTGTQVPVAPDHRCSRNRKVALLLLAALALGWLAYTWPTGTTGKRRDAVESDGAATTVDGGRVLVHQTSVVKSLAPGSPAQQLRGNFTNPHLTPVHVSSVAAAITGTDRPGCSADDFVITGSPARIDAEIAPGAVQGSWSGLTIRMRDRPVNQDACQNTHLTIEYSAH
jgi:hypothetical protein